MDIGEAVTTEYLSYDQATPVSKLMGAFREHLVGALMIEGDADIAGIVTRKQLLSSQEMPEEKARTIMRRDIPRPDIRDDVREVARLMVESDLPMLPLYDREVLEGVVTDTSLARAVRENLDALNVADVYSEDLISVGPDASIGEVIPILRRNGISRVPVIDEDGDAVGMVSYYDLLQFVVRDGDQEQGGSTGGFDNHEGSGSHGRFRGHGGMGERAGDEHALLDLPVSNLMNSPVATVEPTTQLGDAVEEMLERDYTSLLVTPPGAEPDGIMTMTDVLRSLTWTPEDESRLQVFGTDLLTEISREDVAEMIEEIDGKYEEMDVIEAYVILHKHRERQRGMPLIQATIRLFTNKGRLAGTGQEYGAAPALRAARDRLERNVLDEKGNELDERNGERSREEMERSLGWWLEPS